MREDCDVTIEFPGHEPIRTTTEGIRRAADRAEGRASRSRRRLSEGMRDTSELASDMADAGLISGEAAIETADLAKAVSAKLGGPGSPASSFAKDQLKAIVERIERLEEEKKTISDDIKDVYAEAKGNGFDTKALRRIVRLRRLDGPQKAAHAEVEMILETYMQALGML